MKAIGLKMLLFTSNLQKARDFYSAEGIKWRNGDEDVRFGESGLPEAAEEFPDLANLPHLVGDLGGNELFFYFRQSPIPPPKSIHTILMVYFEDQNDILAVTNKLKALGLFSPTPEYEEVFRCLIFDPDGRQIEICAPNPFRI